jgi:hypothetical protein
MTNATAAAWEAGYRGTEASIRQMASRLLTLVNIRAAIAGLTGKAMAKAEKGVIADLTECLEYLTMVKRSRLGDYLGDDGEASVTKLKSAPEGLIRKIKIKSTTDEDGQVYAQHEIEQESALAAVQTLIKHHTGEKDPGDAGRVHEVRQVIFALISGDRGARELLEGLARKAAVDIAPIR